RRETPASQTRFHPPPLAPETEVSPAGAHPAAHPDQADDQAHRESDEQPNWAIPPQLQLQRPQRLQHFPALLGGPEQQSADQTTNATGRIKVNGFQSTKASSV